MKLQFQALLPDGKTLVITESFKDGPMFPEDVMSTFVAFGEELSTAMVAWADRGLAELHEAKALNEAEDAVIVGETSLESLAG